MTCTSASGRTPFTQLPSLGSSSLTMSLSLCRQKDPGCIAECSSGVRHTGHSRSPEVCRVGRIVIQQGFLLTNGRLTTKNCTKCGCDHHGLRRPRSEAPLQHGGRPICLNPCEFSLESP